MPMLTLLKEQLEYALMKTAQDGAKSWHKLKLHLTMSGFAPEILEEYHQDILDIFLACLAEGGHRPSPSKPERSRRPPLPRPPSLSLSLSPSVSSDESSGTSPNRQTKAKSTKKPVRGPEEGWIRLTERSREKVPNVGDVGFCFGWNKETIIGAHIINRYKEHLAPRVKDDIIELVCCLYSRPGRTYDIKCRVEENTDFDILLGKYWQGDEPNEAQKGKGRKLRVEKEGRDSNGSQSTIRPTDNANLPLLQAPVVMPPEYLARLIAEMTRIGGPQPMKRSRRRQDIQPGFDTDLEPTPRIRKSTRVRTGASPWDSLNDEGLDASTASDHSSQLFDIDHQYDGESEGTEITSPEDDQKTQLPESLLREIDDIFN